MDNKELVSVIIPAYNAASTIAQCIRSCIDQQHSTIEIIIVNDGSTDGTQSIIESINDPRIVLINQKNMGCSQAKNIGLAKAKGNFIQYLDADDYLSADKIHIQLQYIKDAPRAIAVCKTIGFSELGVGSEIDTELIQKEGTGLDFLLRLWGADGQTGMVQPNAYLISRELADEIGPWDVTISPNPDEDGEYFSRALLSATWVHFTPGVNFYRKIDSSNSLSRRVDRRRITNQLHSIEKTFGRILSHVSDEAIKTLFARAITGLVYQHYSGYPDVLEEAKELLERNGIQRFSVVQPQKFAFFARHVGFHNALRTWQIIRHLKMIRRRVAELL
jgi:glycosyltransferase involved in cell wall biosynthesis